MHCGFSRAYLSSILVLVLVVYKSLLSHNNSNVNTEYKYKYNTLVHNGPVPPVGLGEIEPRGSRTRVD